ncbi:MAG TPA: type VI secretion system tip protein TssI/VgrG [Steroidobacteraceae bacterium]|jgi:type VI secretion system secreted protein VgrG
MAPSYQDNRSVRITTPFGTDKVLLTRMTGTEQLSRPFRFELALVSSEGQLDPDKILGKPVAVRFTHDSTGKARFFNGIVTEFGHVGYDQNFHQYQAVLRPTLWLLTRRSDCRIFQKQSVTDIVKAVYQEAGGGDIKMSLTGTQAAWDYRVQYGETDFDFVSRLLEHEGIFYYFEHYEDRHDLVLCNDVGKLTTVSGYDKVPYYAPTESAAQRERDHLSSWATQKSFEAGSFASREFNFTTPTTEPAGSATVERRTDARRFELFEYPAGANPVTAAGIDAVAKVRAQQLQTSQTVSRGAGNAAGLATGKLFQLDKYPVDGQNKRYLVTGVSFELNSDDFQSGAARGGPLGGASSSSSSSSSSGSSGSSSSAGRSAAAGSPQTMQFAVSVEAVDARESYRPPLLTPKPRIYGTQTAMVVGTADSEITVDKYGCVKVQFHWDRVGQKNEDSSCWVRVAQAWAGRTWGAHYLPRVKDEVVVSFLEGDPDRPLIIGSVYNADHMPPYTLPDNQTQSGIKSRSTPNGTADNFNELRFEDKKGSEEVYIHAEKDMTVVVENNQSIKIGFDKKDKGDRTTTLQNDDTSTIGNDRTTEVKHDDSLTVDNDRKLTVKNDLTSAVTGKESHTVSKDRATEIKQNDQLKVGDSYTLKATNQITLEVGQAKIVMKSDGTIEISGSQLKLKGTQSAEIDATQAKLSGTQVSVQGTQTKVEGSAKLDLSGGAQATLKGAIVQIN